MANIFNADDGAISGSAGIKLSSDTSGVLNIQTNGVTAISIAANQVVSFPATVGINFNGQIQFEAGTALIPAISTVADTNTGIYFPAADTIAFTEGGVESMRLTSAGNVGIGTGSPSEKLSINSANTSTNSLLEIRQGDVIQAYVGMGSDNILRLEALARPTGVVARGSNYLFFETNGSERARITAAGAFCVGTATPGASTLVTLSSTDSVKVRCQGGTNQNGVLFDAVGGASQYYIGAGSGLLGSDRGIILLDVTNNRGVLYDNQTSGELRTSATTYSTFFTNGSERARIDSSGRFGVGVTPQAWSASISVIQYGNRGTLIANDSVASYGFNGYYDGADKYIASAAAGDHLISGSAHYLRSAPSGTAGNALTWTNVLSIDRNSSLALQGATSQSGTGITFPATQSASSDANTLDDYEEGTWSPSVGGNATYNIQKGSYTKIGRCVTAMFDMSIASIGTGSTTSLGGLPFGSAPPNAPQGIVAPVSYWANLAISVSWVALRLDETSTTMSNQYTTGNQSTASIGGAIFQSGTRIIGTITYFV